MCFTPKNSLVCLLKTRVPCSNNVFLQGTLYVIAVRPWRKPLYTMGAYDQQCSCLPAICIMNLQALWANLAVTTSRSFAFNDQSLEHSRPQQQGLGSLTQIQDL